MIENTKIEHEDIHKYTSIVESQNKISIIDYSLINKHKQKNVRDVGIKRQAAKEVAATSWQSWI